MEASTLIPRWMGDFYAFITECLGYSKNEAMGWNDLTKEHRDLCRFMQFNDKKFKMVLMPRYSLKSCVVTAGYALWNIVKNPNIRILVYSDTSSKACGFLEEMKNHITGKSGVSRFAEFFPGWEGDRLTGKWNDSQILISKREIASKEPTVDTGGIETSKVGTHYDLIFFDDIVSDVNTTTKAQMDKVYDCYRKSLSLLKPGGLVVMTGTRWNFGDAYGRILDEDRDVGEWGTFVRKAELDGEYPFQEIGLTKDFLDAQRARLGSFFYSALYQNNPVDDSTALFKHDNFTFYDRNMSTEGLSITCCCDPAGEGEDFTAFTVVGTDSQMRMYLLYAKHEHYKPNEIIDQIVKLSYAYRFTKFGIETKIFNGMLDKELNLRLAEERKNEKFSPFSVEVFDATCKRGEGKNARILSLQPYHERQALLFPGDSVERLSGSYAELASQMLQWTQTHKPVHDDLVDSLSYHVQMIRPGWVDVQVAAPENSIAKIIERDVMESNRLQKHLPRKYRRYLEPVF